MKNKTLYDKTLNILIVILLLYNCHHLFSDYFISRTADNISDLIYYEDGVNYEYIENVEKIINSLDRKLITKYKEGDYIFFLTDKQLCSNSSVVGTFNSRSKKISISTKICGSSHMIIEVVLHELGHYIDFKEGYLSTSDEFKQIYQNSIVQVNQEFSKYAYSTSSEFFAESFEKYYLSTLLSNEIFEYYNQNEKVQNYLNPFLYIK